jgi:RNA polymerase sigma-70 factor (ECF subfamily)
MAFTNVMEAPVEDPDVVRAAQRGDPGAMDDLARSYYRPALRVAVRLLGNVEDATDATQEAFLRVHRAIRDFRSPWSFRPWLLRIVRNVCFSELRRRRASVETVELGDVDVADPVAVEEVVVERADVAALTQRLGALPAPHRDVIVLRDIEGCSSNEAARRLGISAGALRVRLHRARRELRARF